MERGEEKTNQRGPSATTTELFLQWGNRKRLRCVRVRGHPVPIGHELSSSNNNKDSSSTRIRRKISSRFLTLSHKDALFPHSQPPSRLTRSSDTGATHGSENRRSTSRSPEKEERYYTTRNSVVLGLEENGSKYSTVDGGGGGAKNHHRYHNGGGDETNDNGNGNYKKGGGGGEGLILPKLYITLSSKEKEEDFMALKGCKPPQRPKKRAKVIQRTLLLVSPGAWLTDMSIERYEVREKKSSKKKPRGLKAMGSVDSDSE